MPRRRDNAVPPSNRADRTILPTRDGDRPSVASGSSVTTMSGRLTRRAARPARRRPRASPLEPRPAFTLLEVLVALGLSVLLVTAIYGAISTYVQVSQGDAGVMERSRLARSLFRQMSLDIQSVLFRVEEETATEDETATETSSTTSTVTTGAATGTGATTEESTTEESTEIVSVVDPEAALQSTSVGLIGDAAKLTLHINRPARDLNYSTLQTGGGPALRTSDIQSITYFLANASGSGLEAEVGQRAQQGSPLTTLTDSGPQGLARLAGDRMAMQYADAEADVTTLAAAAQVIAPEVVALQFRYFDGLTWQVEWDSVAAQRLPNAVEITLGLKRIISDEERLAQQFNAAARATFDQVVEYRRHVVSLPLAEPYTEGL